ELEYRVPRQHSAARDYRAPAELLVEAWNALKAYTDAWNQGKSVFDQHMPSLRRFGTDGSTEEEWAQAVVNVRVGPNANFEAMRSALETGGVRVDIGRCFHAVQADRNNALVRAFVSSIRAAGGSPKLRLKTGTSDWNTVAPVWKSVPMVAYGPGDSALD